MRTGARKEPLVATENPVSRVAQTAVQDLAGWLVPIPIEGMLPGAAGREQTPADMLLASVGVGSRKYTASTQVQKLAADWNRNSADPATVNFQKQRDDSSFGTSPYRKLDALLDAGDVERARTEYRELLKDGHTAKQIEVRYDRNVPFTGNQAREQAFIKSLDEHQKAVYREAQKDHEKNAHLFQEIARSLKH